MCSLCIIHVLLVMVLYGGMTSRVALVIAPLLPVLRIGVGNMGLENRGKGFKGGGLGGAQVIQTFIYVEW